MKTVTKDFDPGNNNKFPFQQKKRKKISGRIPTIIQTVLEREPKIIIIKIYMYIRQE